MVLLDTASLLMLDSGSNLLGLKARQLIKKAYQQDELIVSAASFMQVSLWESEKIFGCGALKFIDKEHGEFKSIRIHDDFRNQGNGIKVINHLIDEAKKLNIKRISLETGAGKFFDPARKLFKKCDFQPCKPFAHYKEDVNSIYLTKLINHD